MCGIQQQKFSAILETWFYILHVILDHKLRFKMHETKKCDLVNIQKTSGHNAEVHNRTVVVCNTTETTSSKAYRLPDIQETTCLSRISNVYCHVNNSPSVVPAISQINPLRTLIFCSVKINYNSVQSTSTCPNFSPSGFQTKILYVFPIRLT